MRPLRWLIALAWYGTGLYFVLQLVRGPLLDALHRYHLDPEAASLLDVMTVVLGGVLLIVFFVLVAILVRHTVETATFSAISNTPASRRTSTSPISRGTSPVPSWA